MRIELMTLRLQGIRSSQLSYEDIGAVFVGTCIAEQKQLVGLRIEKTTKPFKYVFTKIIYHNNI